MIAISRRAIDWASGRLDERAGPATLLSGGIAPAAQPGDIASDALDSLATGKRQYDHGKNKN